MAVYKRLISALLAFVLVLGTMPMPVLATEAEEPSEALAPEVTETAPAEAPSGEAVADPAPEETLLAAEPSMAAEAAEETDIPGGSCGESLTWTFDPATGTLTISGTGSMTDSPWDDYRSTIRQVLLPDGLTSICSYAFSNCTALETILIPDSVTLIDGRAFFSCTALTDVTLSKNLETLGDHAFYKCSALPEITIPKELKSCGSSSYPVFEGCTSLETVYIEPGLVEIPAYTLKAASGLKTVHIPDSVTTIGAEAFAETGLETFVMPNTVTQVHMALPSAIAPCWPT